MVQESVVDGVDEATLAGWDEVLSEMAERVEEGEALQDVMNVSEEYVAYAEYQAYKLYSYGRLDKAEVLARGLVALNPARAYPVLLLGEIALKGRDYIQALDLFAAAAQLDPENPEPATKLAEALLRLGDHVKALEVIEQIEAMGLAEDHALLQRARVLARVAGRQS